jgi:GAF domain-containing protein
MEAPQVPPDEETRLAELYSFHILDSDKETEYDRLLDLLLRTTDMPMGTITFVDRDRQRFKAKRGVPQEEISREISFCGHGILSDEPFVVEDARTDPRFADNPLVTDTPGVVFYAGVPLCTENGSRIGMLCVQDTKPRKLTEKQERALRDLAGSVMHLLEVRRLRSHNLKLQQEVDHRVRNTLQFLSSVLSIYKIEIADSPQQVLEEFEERIHGTAALLAESQQLLGTPTARLLHTLKPAVDRLWGARVSVTASGPECSVPSPRAAEILAILDELVLLAYHARHRSPISVAIHNCGGEIELRLGGPVDADRFHAIKAGFRGIVVSALLHQSGGRTIEDPDDPDCACVVRIPLSTDVGSAVQASR